MEQLTIGVEEERHEPRESIDVSIYYDPNKTLSKQRLFNFVIGARGCGKTYGCKKHVIKRFKRYGEQFVYIRRYETEMPAAEMRNFFDDVSVEFEGVKFSAHQGLFRIDNEVAGWYIPLSKATMLKSVPFPNVKLIIFDEFIIETGIYHYLPSEVRMFLECYSTISRDRDVPVLFLSNAITVTNPYFMYFDIHLQTDQLVKLTEFISVEIIKNQAYTDHVKSTKFGRMIAGTDYGKYNIENKFLLDTDDFIMPLPAGAATICTFVLNNRKFGFYVSNEYGLWFLSDKCDKSCKRIFALKMMEHTEQTTLIMRSNPHIMRLTQAYCENQLRFTSIDVKNIGTQYLKTFL